MKIRMHRGNAPAIVLVGAAVAGVTFAGVRLYAQRDNVGGVRNFTRADGSLACGGAADASAAGELAKRGYKSMISLRESSEAGADIAAIENSARAAGIRFVHVPMSAQAPNDGAVAAALGAIRDAGNQPAFLYDASGSRAAAVLMIKRMLVDGWPEDRAYSEAVSIGLSSPGLKAFALDYVSRHR
ncbi:MAG: hypothetical protein JF610_14380 [Acidobacteria bacterium]|nr:hypothetical protein [Acidobacteriota bacterium]